MKRRYKIFLLLVLVAVFLTMMYKPVYKVVYPLRYEEHINIYSEKYCLDKFLVMSLIKAESNFIYDAHSGVARGLMQITDETAEWIAQKLKVDFDAEDIENPEININMGCYYLRYLLDYYDEDMTLALAAYNAGMGNVDNWLTNSEFSKNGKTLDTIPFSETDKYVKKVFEGIEIYKKLYK